MVRECTVKTAIDSGATKKRCSFQPFYNRSKRKDPHYSRHLGSLFLFLFTSFEELCTFVGALLSGHITVYYMASSTSGQDEPNRAL